MDYSKLRDQTMGSGLDEEAVTVNTRALIDKVLARYSGEWTTLRELIQNAADASASKVTIRFETQASPTVATPQSTESGAQFRHVLLHHTLKRLLVSNNGQSFGENDWSRLKRIAEGNPDETKIGAFGVGFYSVFADCESPFVISGEQTMAFFWKGNSLFTRRGKVDGENAKDTTFLLDYRNTSSPVPSLLSLCQFLSTSLTFVGLESIELWIDQWKVLGLVKKAAPAATIKIPPDINPKTKDGLMKISGVESQTAQIDGTWMNAVAWNKKSPVTSEGQASLDQPQASQSLRTFFSRLTSSATGKTAAARKAAEEEELIQQNISGSLAGTSTATVFLRVSTVNVQTNVSKQLAAELERATKKPPPKSTRIAILTSSYDETSASLTSASGLCAFKANEIFASVLPTKNGRIFIGFPTAQTTGLLAHISAPSVIPTVERESIDLNARYVRSWNYEMLRVAGIACRVAYAGEMNDLKSGLERRIASQGSKKPQKADIDAIVPAAAHAFKQYTFQESTPSAQVGSIIEEAFWTCSQKASIEILSTGGVLPSVNVRLASEDLSFVDGIPVVPDAIVEQSSVFLSKLQEYGLLTEITTKDIKKELEAQAITEAQLAELLKWSAKKIELGELDSSAIQTLFDGTVATLEDSAKLHASPVLLLGSITTFPNVSRISADLPMPPDTIPFKFIRGIPNTQLKLFGWNELQIVPWLRFLIEKDGSGLGHEQSITTSPAFSGQVLPVLSKAWESLSQSSQGTVSELLRPRTVIPTKLGMRRPAQAYFSSVRLFDDLPTVHGLQGVKEKFLLVIGVRKTVELSVVFERLMSLSTGDQEHKWSHVDLVKYLVSVRGDIPPDDIDRLRKAEICPAEATGGTKTIKLYKVSDLFEPKDDLRELGLPLLFWPDKFRPASPEASFLGMLGLKQFPTVPDLVNILIDAAARGKQTLYDTTLIYYLANWHQNNYRKYPILSIAKAFLPIQGKGLDSLASPSTCFVSRDCAVLDFNVLRSDLQPQASLLGVAQHPPIALACERLLGRPPADRKTAKAVFEYFSGRLNEIDPAGALAERLGSAPIIPTRSRSKADGSARMISPRACFLGDGDVYGDIFDFVDFGSGANSFLLRIGSKHEPSSVELAHTMVRKPAQLLDTIGADKYLALLRRMADSATLLKGNKALWAEMKKAPCLIAIREVVTAVKDAKVQDDDEADMEDETAIKEFLLTNAGGLVLVDDFASFRIFKDKLVTGPQEEVLEGLYASLGSPWLSSLVDNNQSMGPLLKEQATADKLRNLIVERCRLFLHDHTADAVRHDARWLENTLLVKVTSSLTLRKVLRGFNATYTERMTAALHRDTKKDATLYVTVKPDLFEVSRALMPLLLKRPKQQDFLALEMIMDSELRRLKSKGYNVDRILRQKAAEARLVESQRQKQLQEEQERIAEEEKTWKAAQGQQQQAQAIETAAKSEPTPDKQRPMPGAFDASPEAALAQRPKKGTFLSNIGKQLGITGDDKDKRLSIKQTEQQDASGIQTSSGTNAPPPYSVSDPKGIAHNGPSTHVTPPHELQQKLVSAVQASRAHGSDTLFSPPSTSNVKEQTSYCDSRPGHDLSFVADSRPGVKIYLAKTIPASDRTAFLQQNSAVLNTFAILLLDISQIFLLRPSTLHIFHDAKGSSIAFNTDGSIFCNLRFFMELHWAKMSLAAGKREAAVYWWVTLCHELAHNLVKEHSSEHEFFTETFVSEYFGKMMDKAVGYQDGQLGTS